MYPFNEIFTHLDNGIIYENKKIYIEDINFLWELNVAYIFTVHNDNTIEYMMHSSLTNYEKNIMR